MACISGSGTGSERRTKVWARSAIILIAMPFQMAASPAATLDIHVVGLRSTKGMVRVCLTTAPHSFPDCDKDPAARRVSVAADQASNIRFDDIAHGSYAVSLFHDQNGNGRLDTFLRIPTEGVGFSNHPAMHFGPPSFAQARIVIAGPSVTTIRIRYLL